MMKRVKGLAFLALISSVVLIGVITFPYASAWQSFSNESKKVNTVYVNGETYIWNLWSNNYRKSCLFNVTLVSVYPKAAVEAHYNMFTMQLVFFIVLHPNITEFICDEVRANFRTAQEYYAYAGQKTLSFESGTLVDFYRWNEDGNIAPFSVNDTLVITAGKWPPLQGSTSMLYFVGRIETWPIIELHGRLSFRNDTETVRYGFNVYFNLTSYKTNIYRFNYPLTLWLAYSACTLTLIVSVIYLKRQSLSKTQSV